MNALQQFTIRFTYITRYVYVTLRYLHYVYIRLVLFTPSIFCTTIVSISPGYQQQSSKEQSKTMDMPNFFVLGEEGEVKKVPCGRYKNGEYVKPVFVNQKCLFA